MLIFTVDYQDPVKYVVQDIKSDKTVVDLASVILKLEQSIEPKFLRRPLGKFYDYIIYGFLRIMN